MGTWGTSISSNDTFADVYGDFFDLYNEGMGVSEISAKLIAKYQSSVQEPEDNHAFWFALAKAQWQCKSLDTQVLNRVKGIVESGADLEVWRELDASEKLVMKRSTALDKFLSDLHTEKTKARARRAKTIRQPVFLKGDCLTFKLENGNYGGALVLEAIRDTEYGFNLIVCTRLNQTSKPTRKDIENAEVLFLNFAAWKNNPMIMWYMPLRHKHVTHLIEVVDRIEVNIDYPFQSSMKSMIADFDIHVISKANAQFNYEKENPRADVRQTIRELTRKKRKWKFW